jgi:hypothetical protein
MATKHTIDPALLHDYFKAQREALSGGVTKWIADTKDISDSKRSVNDITTGVVTDLANQHYKQNSLKIDVSPGRMGYEISDGYIWIVAPLSGDRPFLALVMDDTTPFKLDRDGTAVRFKGIAHDERMEQSLDVAIEKVSKFLGEVNKAVNEHRSVAFLSATEAVARHVTLLKNSAEIEERMKILRINKASKTNG